MLNYSSAALLFLAISSTWSSFFWEPGANYAFIFGWACTALLLALPSPKAKPLRQLVCYSPSFLPLIIYFSEAPVFQGWSIYYTTSLIASLTLFLVGHVAFHWASFSVYQQTDFRLSLRVRVSLRVTNSVRILTAVVWLTVYFSVFYLEYQSGFPNSNSPMVWLINLMFVAVSFAFCVLALTPVHTYQPLLWVFELFSLAFGVLFLSMYAGAVSGVNSATSPISLATQADFFSYFTLSPSFFAISVLALAIHRVSSQLAVAKHKAFRMLNEPH